MLGVFWCGKLRHEGKNVWCVVNYHFLRCTGEDCTRVSQECRTMVAAAGWAKSMGWQQVNGRWLCPLCYGETLGPMPTEQPPINWAGRYQGD